MQMCALEMTKVVPVFTFLYSYTFNSFISIYYYTCKRSKGRQSLLLTWKVIHFDRKLCYTEQNVNWFYGSTYRHYVVSTSFFDEESL